MRRLRPPAQRIPRRRRPPRERRRAADRRHRGCRGEAPASPPRAASLDPQPTATTLASQSALGRSVIAVLGVQLRREADQVGELAHRVEVPERRQALESQGVEVVAREQRQVGVGDVDDPRGSGSGAGTPRAPPRPPARTRLRGPRPAGRPRASRPSSGRASPGSRTWVAITDSPSRSSRASETSASAGCGHRGRG